MLEIQNLGLEVPGFALRGNNLQVKEGEFFAVIGPTGSGKSLLLEAIAGLRPLSTGRVLSKGRDISAFPSEKRNVALVYQDYALFPHMDVRKNILYGVYRYRNQEPVSRQYTFLVEKLGLENLLCRRPLALSGGEKQRVALARSLMLSPEVMLLDEPLSALDPVFQDELRELLRELHAELKIPFVMVSHNFSEVMYLADKGAIINQGEIVQHGGIDGLFSCPRNIFCARFTGVKNIFAVRSSWTMQMARVLLRERNIADNRIRYLGFRPEDVIPVNNRNVVQRQCPIFTGRVSSLACHGVQVTARLDVQGTAVTALWPRKYVHSYSLERGRDVAFQIEASKVHCFDAKEEVIDESDA